MSMKVIAYAYVDDKGVIDVATVSPTTLGAQVNAIVTLTDRGIMPLNSWSKEDINRAFIIAKEGKGRIAKVSLEVDE